MKAKEYFAKYDSLLMGQVENDEQLAQSISALLLELSAEVNVLAKQRKARTNSAIAGIVRELNEKWNSICSSFEKKYDGFSPIKFDGFKNYWIYEIPELKRYLVAHV